MEVGDYAGVFVEDLLEGGGGGFHCFEIQRGHTKIRHRHHLPTPKPTLQTPQHHPNHLPQPPLQLHLLILILIRVCPKLHKTRYQLITVTTHTPLIISQTHSQLFQSIRRSYYFLTVYYHCWEKRKMFDDYGFVMHTCHPEHHL